MKVLICDDDLRFLQQIKIHLEQRLPAPLQLELIKGREELFRLLQMDTSYDLLLMDICLEADNGIEAAKQVLEEYPQIPVIFITGYPDLYFEKVFLSLRPWGFVKKPVDWDLLIALVQKCMRERLADQEPYLFLSAREGMVRLAVKEIRYVESSVHRITVHLADGAAEAYGRIAEIQRQLPSHFIHCHKSFLVNPVYVKSYNKNSFTMEDETHIPISQAKRKETRQQFFAYLEDTRFSNIELFGKGESF